MTPELLDESDIGGFVVGEPEFGLGRLVGLDKATARIRYFQGPIADPYLEFECDPEQVVKARVQPHTRVYFHDGRQWKIGRVDSEHPAGDVRYVVALPNLEGDILSQDQFDVRGIGLKNPLQVRVIPDVRMVVFVVGKRPLQALLVPGGGGLFAKEIGPHVVIDADNQVEFAGQEVDVFTADQARGAGDKCDIHVGVLRARVGCTTLLGRTADAAKV